MIVVTGGAGFIGSNLVRGLNRKGMEDIIVVDDLSDGKKFTNLVDCNISDYFDKDEFLILIKNGAFAAQNISHIFHQGACSKTTEWDGRYMLENNYAYSKALLEFSIEQNASFIYASSAAVYGSGQQFIEQRQHERPINVYGYAKFLFDEYLRKRLGRVGSQLVGLRYFNVYGSGEQHKGAMASVAYHLNKQFHTCGRLRLFKGSGGYEDGEQRRDFIHVDDVVAVNLWLMEQGDVSGIFNLGTGKSRSFNDVAQQIIAWHGAGSVEYIDFPDALASSYQSFTEADMSALRLAGYKDDFLRLEQGMKRYLDCLNKTGGQ